METQTALVGSDRAVVLDSVALIDSDNALIIHPRHSEEDHALGLDEHIEETACFVFGMLVKDDRKAVQNFRHSLMKLGLIGIFRFEFFQNFAYITVHIPLLFIYLQEIRAPSQGDSLSFARIPVS